MSEARQSIQPTSNLTTLTIPNIYVPKFPSQNPMTPQYPSIRSFFQTTNMPSSQEREVQCQNRDGLVAADEKAIDHSPLQIWKPKVHYQETDISNLSPGPSFVALTGRVANLLDQSTNSNPPQATMDHLEVLVKDNMGVILVLYPLHVVVTRLTVPKVRLRCSEMEHQLRLGQLVKVWTPHISIADYDTLASRRVSLFTWVFPAKDNSCYFQIQNESNRGAMCKTPLGYQGGKRLPGLITLKDFVNGRHEIMRPKILVCVNGVEKRRKGGSSKILAS